MKKLAVIAGRGRLPADIAAAARDDGLDVLVLQIDGQSDADFSAFDAVTIQLGSIAATRALMVDHHCDSVVMAGKVVRPSLANLMPDVDALKLLGKAITKGDDGVLRLISAYFDAAGIATIKPTIFMPDRLVDAGVICDAGTDPKASKSDLDLAMGVLARLSDFDVGQAVIVQDGRVLAVEAAEGTKEMLARSAAVIDNAGPAALMAKMPKAGQDMRLDMPVIGVDTISQAAAAGVRLVAIAAGGVLLADSCDDIVAECTARGVSLIGVDMRSAVTAEAQ